MFTGMSKKEDELRSHLSDWLSGAGGVLVTVIGLGLGALLLIELVRDVL